MELNLKDGFACIQKDEYKQMILNEHEYANQLEEAKKIINELNGVLIKYVYEKWKYYIDDETHQLNKLFINDVLEDGVPKDVIKAVEELHRQKSIDAEKEDEEANA